MASLSDDELRIIIAAKINDFTRRMESTAASMQWRSDGSIVWHYTSLNTAKLILAAASGTPLIRASSNFNEGINDEYDGRWLAYNLGQSTGGRATGHLLNASKAELFLLCLSLDADSKHHWDEYADHEHGVALGFRDDALHTAAKIIGDPQFIEVRYSSPADNVYIELKDLFVDLHKAVFAATGAMGGNQRNYWRGTADLVAENEWFFKSDEWTQDQERRIAYKRPPNPKSCSVGGETRSWVEIPFAPALEEIRLAPKCDPFDPAFEADLKSRFHNLRSITKSAH